MWGGKEEEKNSVPPLEQWNSLHYGIYCQTLAETDPQCGGSGKDAAYRFFLIFHVFQHFQGLLFLNA